jgi:hypothetical protein
MASYGVSITRRNSHELHSLSKERALIEGVLFTRLNFIIGMIGTYKNRQSMRKRQGHKVSENNSLY